MAEAHNFLPSPPRTIVIQDAAPPVIRAALLQSTLIMLPEQEKVATVFGGDIVNWIIDGGHVASRFISVKPKSANVSTDVHIVSDHGNEYTLQLREISEESDAHFDSKVILEPGDQTAKDKLASVPVFVPAAELDRVKKEAEKAQADAEATRKTEQSKNEQYRAEYPSSLKFDYSWDAKKGTQLGLQQIWHDDKFTYLRGQFQETPALYEVKDGKASLINFDFASGLYTVPKLLDRGYLAIGKKKVEFYRQGAR
ncbi:MAG: TrbG/VirB9 family P-type conjugative transfer protein [Acidobacteriaceae bacterium]|nr:TrbG/VirB9 family P-type conjugative transfer protein [Acidobacteriaceae bacterium]